MSQARNAEAKARAEAAFEPYRDQAAAMLQENMLSVAEIRKACHASERLLKEMAEELGIDLSVRSRRVLNYKSSCRAHARIDWDRMKSDLDDLTISYRTIIDTHRISHRTLKEAAAKLGVDYDARCQAFRRLHKTRPKDPAASIRAEIIATSMTGDGFSLAWLKKPWRVAA